MFESLFALFAFGTVWFWILMAVAVIAITAFVENEHYVFPSILSACLLAIYWKALHALLDWRGILLFGVIYAVCGCLWSIFRWFRHVRGITNDCREKYGTRLTSDQHETLIRMTTVGRYKSKVTAWILFWPMSLFWNIFGDSINMLYENMVKIYSSISRRHVAQFSKMTEAEEEAARTEARRSRGY